MSLLGRSNILILAIFNFFNLFFTVILKLIFVMFNKFIKSRRMRWTEHAMRMGEMGNVYKILVGKSEGKRSLRICRHTWEYNIKTDLRETGFGGVDWIQWAQDRD
jgi:hypothetical protein